MKKTILCAENLGVTYRTASGQKVEALKDVNLTAANGEFISVVGPSGCGKTTLLKILSGLLKATHGNVTIDGAKVTGPHSHAGIVFQNPVLLEWRTVLSNVLLQAEVRGLNLGRSRNRALELLKLVGLEGFENKFPYELSGGMQQRVSICRALIHDPSLLLMDEPFGALDAFTREKMNLELQRIWMENTKTVVFITHSLSEAVFLGDKVWVMSRRPGTVTEIFDINLPRPRTIDTFEHVDFVSIVGEIRRCLQDSVA